MEKKSLERGIKDRRGLENISNLFLSSSEKVKGKFAAGRRSTQSRRSMGGWKINAKSKKRYPFVKNLHFNMMKMFSKIC